MALHVFRPNSRTWVLGGGGGRGAAQVGVLLALLESGIEPPHRVIGVSVGALNAATLAAFPSVAGVQMLRQTWLSKQARAVFRPHPMEAVLGRLRGTNRLSVLPSTALVRLIQRQLDMIGVDCFEELKLPLEVSVTDLAAGAPRLFWSGPLLPALQASTAIPGIFPAVPIDGHFYVDGGVADNEPIGRAVDAGAREVLVVALMAGLEMEHPPRNWGELMARTVAMTLHSRLLSEFARLRQRCRLTVLCPMLAPTSAWNMERVHVEDVMERSRDAVLRLLADRGSTIFRRSGIHYLDLGYG